MRPWQSTIHIWDLHAAYQAGDASIAETARQLAARVRRNRFFIGSEELEEIAERLEEEVRDVDDYDSVLSDLYDFGDYDRRIWINKFAPNERAAAAE